MEAGAGRDLTHAMRFFFHIADRYGLFPDGIGQDCRDQDAAILHARRLAAELAKAGEFCRGSVVLVASPPQTACGAPGGG
ncbi:MULTISPECIES: DUF6894 family protein [Bradyrhizobium]|uniref:DUF6894 domain-containing protein n=1 Tax=Bradyrhizobium ottawaense TaxID=931866 RepID=A0ABV4G818_9BRAD|nr:MULTISPECIES: hypothetical protein [unclassified Bradyrhizobium]